MSQKLLKYSKRKDSQLIKKVLEEDLNIKVMLCSYLKCIYLSLFF